MLTDASQELLDLCAQQHVNHVSFLKLTSNGTNYVCSCDADVELHASVMCKALCVLICSVVLICMLSMIIDFDCWVYVRCCEGLHSLVLSILSKLHLLSWQSFYQNIQVLQLSGTLLSITNFRTIMLIWMLSCFSAPFSGTSRHLIFLSMV